MQGLILINKPKGITSAAVVGKIRRLAHEKRVGHTGTLDPMATGVLPIFIGRATALSGLLLDADKVYDATFRFGTVTDTADITGEVLKTYPVNITTEQIFKAFDSFTGEISQIPPMYSALKRDGVPLYKLAREGKTVEIEPRTVTINSIEALSELCDNEITVRVSCSKGTYIRSLCRDIGEHLGCGATLSALVRRETSGFTLENCISLDDLTEENIKDYVLPEETAVRDFRKVQVSSRQAVRFSNGGALSLERLNFKPRHDGELVRVKREDKFLGLGRVDSENNQIAIKCVINSYTLPEKTAVALGTFDGVHSGHRAVIQRVVESPYKKVAVTFLVPPKSVLDKSTGILTPPHRKKELLKNCGIEQVEFLDFKDCRHMAPLDFLSELKQKYNCALISCGFNYRFGKDGAGDTALLSDFCEKNNIVLLVAEPVCENGTVVSSSLIREELKNGRVEAVKNLCGYDFGFTAEIIHGDARGRTIGFPTVNQIYPSELVKVKFGVYKSRITLGGQEYNGITNIGVRPTFKTDFVSAETHIIGFSGDAYGQTADLRLVKFIREEKKFDSLDELKQAINNDLQN